MSGVARWALEVFITNESGTKTLQPRPSTINFTMTVNQGREDQVAFTKRLPNDHDSGWRESYVCRREVQR